MNVKREKVKPRNIVGIDLGVKDLVVTSSGEKYQNPKEIKRFEKRIKRLQRKLSRQIKGRYFYKYKKAKEENNHKESKKQLLKATFVIFLIHGYWDTIISLVGHFASVSKMPDADLIGGILFIVTILFGITYIINSIIKIKKVLKNKNT